MSIIPMPNDSAIFKLFQLISPSLPIGGFTYSQGTEWAVDAAWITDSDSLGDWVTDLLETNMLYLELPLLIRLYITWEKQDLGSVKHWNQFLLASRESSELRQEELNRARAMSDLMVNLEPLSQVNLQLLKQSQTSCYAFACVNWQLGLAQACQGFVWAWLENLVLSAIKIIPLGQTDGQLLLLNLGKLIPNVIEQAMLIDDEAIGYSNPALAIASSLHETQYTRIFRS